jgi:hypothetical protein
VQATPSRRRTLPPSNLSTRHRAAAGPGANSSPVSVSGVEDNETIVTVRADAEGQATLTEGGQQRKLIAFLFDKLEEIFPLSANQKQIANAPGTSGCFGILLLLVTAASCIAFSVGTFLAGQ